MLANHALVWTIDLKQKHIFNPLMLASRMNWNHLKKDRILFRDGVGAIWLKVMVLIIGESGINYCIQHGSGVGYGNLYTETTYYFHLKMYQDCCYIFYRFSLVVLKLERDVFRKRSWKQTPDPCNKLCGKPWEDTTKTIKTEDRRRWQGCKLNKREENSPSVSSSNGFPICSTSFLASVMMLAPVWQTIPAISMENLESIETLEYNEKFDSYDNYFCCPTIYFLFSWHIHRRSLEYICEPIVKIRRGQHDLQLIGICNLSSQWFEKKNIKVRTKPHHTLCSFDACYVILRHLVKRSLGFFQQLLVVISG